MATATQDVVLHPIPEAAKILGCSPDTVYRLIASGDLDPVDIAPRGSRQSKTRVRSDHLQAFIKHRTRGNELAARHRNRTTA